MSDYPNIARLALADPDKLTSRQLQIHCVRQDYEKPARGSMHQVDKDARMAAAVPSLLAHIDELYSQIESLQGRWAVCVADELAAWARDLYRRADNLPLTDEHQVQRVGDFRETADKLTARAKELRGAQ